MSVLKWIGVISGGILVAYAVLMLVRALAFAAVFVSMVVAEWLFNRKRERAA